MNKVGIVTWYWGNYGSILQAFAIEKAVLSLGFDCEIIKHHVNGSPFEQLSYRISHNGILHTAEYIYKKLKSGNCKSEVLDCRQLRENTFNNFISNHLSLSKKEYNNANYRSCIDYDIYICGSDQIWNPNFTFYSSFYWLSFLPSNKKLISYAPSFGIDDIKEKDKNIISAYLNRYDAISVREEKSTKVLQPFSNKTIEAVCDPTILLCNDEWQTYVPERAVKEKYLFAYLIRGNKEQRDYITRIANQLGLKLVVYPYLERNEIIEDELTWGDIRIFDDDPFDFLGKIFYSDMVITDSFHCSVFSLHFHKDFYVLKKTNDTGNQFNRLDNLLSICKQNKRVIDIKRGFESVGENPNEIDSALNRIRDKSWSFLKNAL